MQVLGQLLGPLKVVDVDVGLSRGAPLVVLGLGPHHDGHDVVAGREARIGQRKVFLIRFGKNVYTALPASLPTSGDGGFTACFRVS